MSTTIAPPVVHGTIGADGSLTIVRPDGDQVTRPGTDTGPLDLAVARRQLITEIAVVARSTGHDRVIAHLSDPQSGTMTMAVTSAGAIEAALPPHLDEPQLTVDANPVNRTIATRVEPRRTFRHTAPPTSTPGPVSTFLVTEPAPEPARLGWRGAANRFGLALEATETEISLRRSVRAISQHWPGLRTVAVVNAKGSASKTPTTIGLSAAFARYGGGGIAAVDNNPTRGTLGWRTEQGPHSASVTDLLPHIDALMAADASASQMAAFLHHQTEDRYDVLRSKPERLGPPFTADEFDAVVRVLSKYYRLLIFDSGNDETAAVWRHMIDAASQLVVPTLARREWAEAGRLLLDELSRTNEHGAHLVANAVVIVSQADERQGVGPAHEIAAGFQGLVRATAVVPFDPHMVEGHMRWDGLARTTRDAWIRAAALVADGF